MVNAAVDIQYGKDFYKKGANLTENLIKNFEIHNPSLLDNYIELNGRWQKIENPDISGFVEENKTKIQRLIDFYGIKKIPEKEEKPEPTMLTVKKIKIAKKKKK